MVYLVYLEKVMFKSNLAVFAACVVLFSGMSALQAQDKDVEALRPEVLKLKQAYEAHIAELESRLDKVEKTRAETVASTPARPATAKRLDIGLLKLDLRFNFVLGNRCRGAAEELIIQIGRKIQLGMVNRKSLAWALTLMTNRESGNIPLIG